MKWNVSWSVEIVILLILLLILECELECSYYGHIAMQEKIFFLHGYMAIIWVFFFFFYPHCLVYFCFIRIHFWSINTQVLTLEVGNLFLKKLRTYCCKVWTILVSVVVSSINW